MPITWFDNVKIPGLKDQFEKAIRKDMSDQEKRDIGTKIVMDYYNQLFEKINTLKQECQKRLP